MDLLKVVLASEALVIMDVNLSGEVIYSFYQFQRGIYDPQALVDNCTTQSSRSIYNHKAVVGKGFVHKLIIFIPDICTYWLWYHFQYDSNFKYKSRDLFPDRGNTCLCRNEQELKSCFLKDEKGLSKIGTYFSFNYWSISHISEGLASICDFVTSTIYPGLHHLCDGSNITPAIISSITML